MEPKSTAESIFTTDAPAYDPKHPLPPIAARRPVEHSLHGDLRTDDYAWLRQKENPEVVQHLKAENAYAKAVLGPTEAFQEKLYQEMLSRIQQTDLTVPYKLRGYSYFTKTVEGLQYPVHYRRPDDGPPIVGLQHVVPQLGTQSSEELLLDLNALAEGHSFLGLGAFEVSDDNRLLAYSTDTTGFQQYTLQIKDLQTGQLLPFRAERVTSAAWAKESPSFVGAQQVASQLGTHSRTLLYTVEDPVTKRSHRLYRHTLGATSADPLVYEEPDERFRIEIERTRSGSYLILLAASHTASEVRYLPAGDPSGEFQLIAPREDNHEYYVEHHPNFATAGATSSPSDVFLIRTNSGGRTFRLVAASVSAPQPSNWQELVPNRPAVMLSAAQSFRSHLVLFEREDGLPFLRVIPIAEPSQNLLAASYRIEFNEPAYNAAPGMNPEFEQTHFRYSYESFVTPRSIFDFEVRTRQSILRKQQPVLGGYDATLYASERLHAVAPDGTRIPISIVYRKDTARDGRAPLLLYGYGSYGISMPVNFSSNRLSLLDRGVIYAIAHIRGGGELGKPWHDAGRMHQKKNTFADFIASAEHLIADRFTSSKKLIIEGGSAGGLLMGAVSNLRADLFHTVISHVPFVDVLNTMLDASLPLTVGEYEEWGNPQIAEDYFYIKNYCPYTNLESKAYPAMLVKTGLNDSQVMYWEPAKYVAKLRRLKTDSNLLLFKINMGAGHGGASGRYDYLREIALDYAFLLHQIGIHS
jgi:oligopeptidase B